MSTRPGEPISPTTSDVVLVSDTTTLGGNWGCRATTLALADLVEASGGRVTGVVPALDIEVGPAVRRLASAARSVGGLRGAAPTASLLDAPGELPRLGRSGGRFRRVEQVGERLDAKALPTPSGVADLETTVDQMLASGYLAPHIEVMRSADLVLVNGEGSIYGGQAKGRRLLALCHLAKTRLGRRVAVVNQTVDAADPAEQELIERVLAEMDDVSFREPVSAKRWGHLVPGGREPMVPDAAFGLAAAGAAEFWAMAQRPDYFATWPDRCPPLEPGYVCVGGSSALLRADGSGFDPGPGYEALCGGLVAAGHQVVCTSSDRTDELFLRPIARRLGLPHIGVATSVPQATDVLAHARVLITGRWHPSILASAGGTPVVSLGANSCKTEGFQALIGTGGAIHDARITADSAGDLQAAALELIAGGEPLRDRIRTRAGELCQQTPELVRSLAGEGT